MKLRKCQLLLPTRFNDGAEVPRELLTAILEDIDREFFGHSMEGFVEGMYRMADGTMARDRSLKIVVAVRPEQVDALRTLARRFAHRLRQETLWFELTDSEVEFLPPLADDGDEHDKSR